MLKRKFDLLAYILVVAVILAFVAGAWYYIHHSNVSEESTDQSLQSIGAKAQQESDQMIEAAVKREGTTTVVYPGIATTTQTGNRKIYTNDTYQFQIQYPFFMQEVSGASSTIVGFCWEGDSLCLEYPPEHLPNIANFEGAAMAIEILPDHSSASSCEDLSDTSVISTTTIASMSGTLFYSGNFTEGWGGHMTAFTLYRTYHNSRCYKIELEVDTYRCDGQSIYDSKSGITYCDGHPTANVEAVENEMKSIVATFRFLK